MAILEWGESRLRIMAGLAVAATVLVGCGAGVDRPELGPPTTAAPPLTSPVTIPPADGSDPLPSTVDQPTTTVAPPLDPTGPNYPTTPPRPVPTYPTTGSD
jgi:hypothetical protein